MSRHADIVWDICRFCAVREIEQEEAIELCLDVLGSAGQMDYDEDDDDFENKKNNLRKDVELIYKKVLDYQTKTEKEK